MDIQRTLQNIGLSQKEIKIYLALLQLNQASVLDLAKHTHLKRTTIYPFLNELKSKGLVEWGVGKYAKRAKVREPKQILRYAKAQKRKYARSVMKLEENLTELEKCYTEDISDVSVKYYDGIDECREMCTEMFKAKSEIVSYSSWMKYPYLGKEWCVNFYDKLQHMKNFSIEREIISATEHNLYHAKEYIQKPNYKKNYFFKFIPPRKEFIKVDTHIFDDSIITFSFKGVKPNGIFIKNKDLAQSDKAIFEVLFEEVALYYEDYLAKYNIDPKKLKHSHEDIALS